MEEVFGAADTFARAGSLLRERTPAIAPVTLAPLEELREQADGSVLRGLDGVSFPKCPSSQTSADRRGDPVMRTGYLHLADDQPAQTATSWKPMAVTGQPTIVLPEIGHMPDPCRRS